MEKDAIVNHLTSSNRHASETVTFADLGALFGVPTDRQADEPVAAAAPAVAEIDYDKLAAAIKRAG